MWMFDPVASLAHVPKGLIDKLRRIVGIVEKVENEPGLVFGGHTV